MIGLWILDFYLRLKAKTDWKDRPRRLGPLKLGYVENYGVYKGLLKNQPKKALRYQMIFVLCSVLYTFYIMARKKSRLYQAGWLLTSIGGMANLYDRAWNGFVTDYVSVSGKLYFNIADVLIFAGCALSCLHQLFSGVMAEPSASNSSVPLIGYPAVVPGDK